MKKLFTILLSLVCLSSFGQSILKAGQVDTATILNGVVHINKAETILGPKTFNQLLTINLNTGVAAPSLAFVGQTGLQINGLDGQTNVLEFNTNGHVLVEGWKYNGTAGLKTGLVNNDEIIAFGGGGWYDATHRTAEAAAALQFFASETWSSTANGSYATLKITKNTTNALVTGQQWNNDQSAGILGNFSAGEAVIQNPSAYSTSANTMAEIYGPNNSSSRSILILLAHASNTTTTVGEVDFDAASNTSGYNIARMYSQLAGATSGNKGGNIHLQTKKNAGSLTDGIVIDENQLVTSTGSIVPSVTNSVSLGSSSLVWQKTWTNSISSSSSSGLTITSPGANNISFSYNGSTILTTPTSAGTLGQVMTAAATGATPVTWSTTALVQATADLTAQTTAGNVTTFTVGASTATFDISSYINVTAVAVDVIQGQITYTDENNTAQTISLQSLSAIGNSTYNPTTIRAKNGTVITVKTNLTTGAGSITFDAGARITQL